MSRAIVQSVPTMTIYLFLVTYYGLWFTFFFLFRTYMLSETPPDQKVANRRGKLIGSVLLGGLAFAFYVEDIPPLDLALTSAVAFSAIYIAGAIRTHVTSNHVLTGVFCLLAWGFGGVWLNAKVTVDSMTLSNASSPMPWSLATPPPEYAVVIRGLQFTVMMDGYIPSETQTFVWPLYSTFFVIAAGIVAALVMGGLLRLVRRPNWPKSLQNGMICGLLILQPSVPEAFAVFAASTFMGCYLDTNLPGASRRPSKGSRIVLSALLVLLGIYLANAILWQFVAINIHHYWSLVALAYGIMGLSLGQARRLWNLETRREFKRTPSLDGLLRRRLDTGTSPWRFARLDLLANLAPYLSFTALLGVAIYVRKLEVNLAAFLMVVGGIAALAAYFIAQIAATQRASRRLGLPTGDTGAEMALFSRASYGMAQLDPFVVTTTVLLPMAIPVAGAMYLGATSPMAISLFFVAVIASIYLLHRDRTRPAAVLVLGASVRESVELHANLSCAVRPLRVVSLLETDELHEYPKHSPAARDCLRTILEDRWLEIIRRLLNIIPLIVLDGRTCTQPVLDELAAVNDLALGYKTIIVTDPDGKSAVAERWRECPPHGCLPDGVRLATERDAVDLVVQLSRSRSTLPTRTPRMI